MESCCQSKLQKTSECPNCLLEGKSVKMITLKSLLKPTALAELHSKNEFSFCSSSSCNVVYFSENQTFLIDDLKVTVFQKSSSVDADVCYCFGWTRKRLSEAIHRNISPEQHIREQIQENRCGCEVNNPQGRCCLGNIRAFIQNVVKD